LCNRVYNAEIPATSAEHKHRRHATAVPSGTRTPDTNVQAEGCTRLKPVSVPVNLTYKNTSRHTLKTVYCARLGLRYTTARQASTNTVPTAEKGVCITATNVLQHWRFEEIFCLHLLGSARSYVITSTEHTPLPPSNHTHSQLFTNLTWT
jgi:hypothetical protein